MNDHGWIHAHTGLENDDAKVGGLLVWKHRWISTGSTIRLPENADVGRTYAIYRIGEPPWPTPVTFAATEKSNGVWSFWIPGP